jgi:hypothetical protein
MKFSQDESEITVQQDTERAAQAGAALEAARRELYDAHQANHRHCQLAGVNRRQTQALLSSSPTHIAFSLRWISTTARRIKLGDLRRRIKLVLQHAALNIGRRPRLKRAVSSALNRFPGLYSRLVRTTTGMATLPVRLQGVPDTAAHLSPHARQIYADLKDAIKRRQRDQM